MKRWYVLQVYAGYEEAIKKDVQRRIHEGGLEDNFGEILIPSAKLRQMFNLEGSQDEQLFPGYILIEVAISTETMRLVLSNPRVIRFLGGTQPVPLSKKEIDRIISQMKGEVQVAVTEKVDFVIGSEVEIQDGPFAGFIGIVDKVDKESEKLTVMVSIFGRMTPVELSFNQVKR